MIVSVTHLWYCISFIFGFQVVHDFERGTEIYTIMNMFGGGAGKHSNFSGGGGGALGVDFGSRAGGSRASYPPSRSELLKQKRSVHVNANVHVPALAFAVAPSAVTDATAEFPSSSGSVSSSNNVTNITSPPPSNHQSPRMSRCSSTGALPLTKKTTSSGSTVTSPSSTEESAAAAALLITSKSSAASVEQGSTASSSTRKILTASAATHKHSYSESNIGDVLPASEESNTSSEMEADQLSDQQSLQGQGEEEGKEVEEGVVDSVLFTQSEIMGLRLMFSLFDRCVRKCAKCGVRKMQALSYI